jgi:hypothetical protein
MTKPKLEQGTLCAINKSYGSYSSGTKVQVINDSNHESPNPHGFVTIMVLFDGKVFDIEYDYLTVLRRRAKYTHPSTRAERRKTKQR